MTAVQAIQNIGGRSDRPGAIKQRRRVRGFSARRAGRSSARVNSRIGLPQGKTGREKAVLVGDAERAAQGQVLGEDREIGKLADVDDTRNLRLRCPPRLAAMAWRMAFSNCPLLIMS